ncbi:MAG: S8 family serine peptidase [Saprospiraceae bacterium]|nr:S8 family serine peptidase [Saprospiraceae bacterium]
MKKLFTLFLLLLTYMSTAFAQTTLPVRFAHGTVLFPENFANVRQNPKVDPGEIVAGKYVRYIQLNNIMNSTERRAFEATGAQILGYVQTGAYLVSLPQNFDYQRIEIFSPRSVMPVDPSWKLAKSLREQPFGSWAVKGEHIDINVQVYPHVSIQEGAEWCRHLGVDILKEGNQNGFIQLRVHKEKISTLAALPFLQYLELVPAPGQKEDTRGRSLHRANLVASDGPMGKKYDGSGVSVLVRDDGQLGPHIDLTGRLYNYADGSPTSGTHGDGVVGIVGGAGNLDPSKKGMAAGADLYSVDYVNDFQDLTMPLHFEEGVTITNSSYSDGCNTGYTLATQIVDQQLFENPTLMHVFSAGNSNGSDCGYGAGTQWGNITGGHKMSKNAIATANIYADATLVTSSSRGPAYDGRLKPDIAANGQDQESLDPNNGYQVFGGTSGAAPGIAGCLAQLTHAYRTIHNVADAPSALLKATILNTANDLGNVGPDYKFGWGHINAWRALRLLEQNRWLEADMDQNGLNTHSIQIPSGTKEAKIMIYWAEPPSLENNARALINDLDLTVENAAGTVNLPWLLNPAPNATTLDAPAGKGRDSLNNVEQVLITDPAAGTYTIKVKGTEVPMGPQHYYIVWEFVRDEIKVTYPSGGEGFVPGEVERLHWDAFGNTGTFTLRYTTDGGQTFFPIASVTGDRRMYDWTVPNTVSGKVHVLAIRGAKRDTSDFPSSIVGIPQNLTFGKVCPDTAFMSFDAVNDSLHYDGFLLGEKYMELKGTADTNWVGIPISNPFEEFWTAVRSSYPDGTAGRRTIAVNWPGGLFNCPQSHDLNAAQLISPVGDAIVSCGASEINVTVRLINDGLNEISGAFINYQVNNDPPVSEPVPDLSIGASLDYTFQTPLSLNFNGNIQFRTWITYPSDVVAFNDTIALSFPIITQAADQLFTETFEASSSFPPGWVAINPDGEIGWVTTDALLTPVVGPDDLIGRSLHMNFYEYGPSQIGQEDYVYMIPLDLTTLSNATLNFYISHARYDATYTDGMRVEIYENCDLNGTPTTVWEKFDPDLGTVPDQTSYFIPGSAEDWRSENIDLAPFVGQKIVVRFASIDGWGNSLYLDNVGLVVPEPPIAEFVAPDSICRLDTVIFQATPSTDNSGYTWTFGSAAIPGTASGIGPHSVVYPTAGNKNVRLIVTNPFGADTQLQVINVRQLANANFTFTQNLLTVTFNNTSNNSTSYLWDFGDGMTSTDVNPVHTYSAPGTYTVTLSATNVCRTHIKTGTVGVTAINELENRLGIQILPNPTAGDFAVTLDSKMSGSVQFLLFDAAGRKITNKEVSVKHGPLTVPFENLDLPKGVYQLNILAEGKQATFNIVVQ